VLLVGDCVEQMRTLPADSVDAIVTDPPYGLEFMGKAWDGFGTPLGFQTWSEQWAREALRVLKPGGHLLAFGGTRMYHRLAAGIEDAGFEIRDTLMWLYGSGFPKSLDVSKAIDKAAGAERNQIIGWTNKGMPPGENKAVGHGEGSDPTPITSPVTDSAKKWEGWGTALKPAVEPIVLARKPLIGTVAENVLTHGTGALNIDASRIATPEVITLHAKSKQTALGKGTYFRLGKIETHQTPGQTLGRWPANILLDEEAAALLDEQSGESKSIKNLTSDARERASVFGAGDEKGGIHTPSNSHGDTGGASRFFYVAKASRSERNAGLDRNIHPTVKPVALMAYLIRLVTPKGGTVLDPFMGSGTTAVAAIQEGVNWIGCEREPEYVAIIEARIAAAQPGMGLNLEEDKQ